MCTKEAFKRQGGFTLVETLVAISILLVAVVGPIGLIGDATFKIYYARDQMIAINLAQEGIEAVRHLRDNNLLTGVSWDTGYTPGNYVVDTSLANPLIVCGGCDQKIYLDASNSKYLQGGGTTATQFSRLVTTANVASNTDERQVASTVTWVTGGTSGTITVTEYIYKLLP